MTSAELPTASSNQPDKALVWIIVLHYLGSELTAACLDSLTALDYPNYRVLLLDNKSPDESGAQLASQFPEIAYLQSQRNLGFAGGCNLGAKYCMAQGAEWLWFLNNDTRVPPDALTTLMDSTALHLNGGVFGAMVYDQAGNFHSDAGIGTLDYLRGKALMRIKPVNQSAPVACAWISGCNMLMHSSVFQKTGGFDEDFFLYWEDIDLCQRIREQGLSCYLVPKANIEHLGNASTTDDKSIWRSYYHTRNRLLFFERHATGVKIALSLTSIISHVFRHQLVLPFRGDLGRRQKKAEWLAYQDWISKKFGEANCLNW